GAGRATVWRLAALLVGLPGQRRKLRDRLAMRVEGRVDEGLTVALLEHFPGQFALGLALARRGHRGGIGHGAACVETGHDHARRAVNLPCAEVSDGPGLHGSLTLVARYSVWPPMLPSFRTLSALGATLLLAVLASACAARGAQGATVLPTGTGPAFEYAYAPPTAPGLQAIHQRVRDADLWRRLPEMQAIDGMFALPRPLRYVAAECGEFGAFYRPADAEVVLCYETLRTLHERGLEHGQMLGLEGGMVEEHALRYVLANVRFIVLHETGHGLADLLDLPVTGRQEDVVDQLAAILML